ncbi:MAG: hypothetical protein R3D53_13725 [Paracoccaceae bacterium]|mgnify:CR=1 FL=1|jgi:hypothetical protein
MNLNQLINMAVNIVTRRLMNIGINKGIDAISRRGNGKAPMTPEEARQAKTARAAAKRARQAARITRRMR